MAEPVEWRADGTPVSPRFGDIYRSASGGLAQARHVFLDGCGLPGAWRNQAQWRILETGFGLGLNFLATWRSWKDDTDRPARLHFVSVEAWPVAAADLLRSAEPFPDLRALAAELAAQWQGLVPGFHRLSFEHGQVLLTLCIGDIADVLGEIEMQADAVFLDGFGPGINGAMWEVPVLKRVARLCQHGSTIATWTVAGEVRRALRQCGFEVQRLAGLAPKRECLRGRYDPAWLVKRAPPQPHPTSTSAPQQCVVIGGGLAGAATASSLARRGWQVAVVDEAAAPAAGASGLPVGLMAPYQSPDDNLLSRLTRAGVRMTVAEAQQRLRAGKDWQLTGALELRGTDQRQPPAADDGWQHWTRPATRREVQDAGLPAGTPAWWHPLGAWLRPAALVQSWLSADSIRWLGGRRVSSLRKDADRWLLLDLHGNTIASAPVVVVAAAVGSAALLDGRVQLTPVRGQVCWGLREPAGPADADNTASVRAWPPFPINGRGHLIPDARFDGQRVWLCGSTYVRNDADTRLRASDHAENLDRLRALAGDVARELEPQWPLERAAVHAWSAVRCASADRRPLAGELASGLWVCTAMGSRGLSLAPLCAELLAAQLNAEPLPLPRKLAKALAPQRHPHSSSAQHRAT